MVGRRQLFISIVVMGLSYVQRLISEVSRRARYDLADPSERGQLRLPSIFTGTSLAVERIDRAPP